MTLPTEGDDPQLCERSVLGALLLHPDALADVPDLGADDFAEPRHREIFRAVVESHTDTGATDPIAVAEVLRRRGRLADVGGENYLLDLLESVVTAAGIAGHAELLRERSFERQVLDQTQRIAAAAKHGYDVSDAAAALAELTARGSNSRRQQHGPRVADWREVAALPPVPEQIEGLWPMRSVVVVAGASLTAKSLLVQDWCARMVSGLGFRGLAVEPGSVLYFAGEGFAGLGSRLRAWLAQNDAAPCDGRYFDIVEGVPNLSSPEGRRELVLAIERFERHHGHAPSLIVLDTLSQALGAGDENDASAMAPVTRDLAEIRTRFGCTVLVVHHLAKPSNDRSAQLTLHSVRGSSALVNNVDVVLAVAVKDGVQTLTVLKLKDGEQAGPIRSVVLGVETGHLNAKGLPERAPILVPAPDEREEPAADLDASAEADVALLVAKLREIGEVPSANSLVRRCHGNRADLLAAFKEAVVDGRIVDLGTARRHRYVVPASGTSRRNHDGEPDNSSEGGSESVCVAPPHTPPRFWEPGTAFGVVPNRWRGSGSGNQWEPVWNQSGSSR